MTCSFALSEHPAGGLGPGWVRGGLGVGVMEPVGEVLGLVGERVAVAVQGHRGRGVAELGLDRLDAGALGDEQARAVWRRSWNRMSEAGLKMPATNFCSRSGPPCRVVVVGRLQQRAWTAEDGSARSVVEVMAEELGPSLRWATATTTRMTRI